MDKNIFELLNSNHKNISYTDDIFPEQAIESDAISFEDFLINVGALKEEDLRDQQLSLSAQPLLTNQFPLTQQPSIAQELPTDQVASNVNVPISCPLPSPPPQLAMSQRMVSYNSRRRCKRHDAKSANCDGSIVDEKKMMKNRESSARSIRRQEAYRIGMEIRIEQLVKENAEMSREEAENRKRRFKQLMKDIIPVAEKRKPRVAFKRIGSAEW